MTSDLDIYRSANVLIREHGEDVAIEAAKHADAHGTRSGGVHATLFGGLNVHTLAALSAPPSLRSATPANPAT